MCEVIDFIVLVLFALYLTDIALMAALVVLYAIGHIGRGR